MTNENERKNEMNEILHDQFDYDKAYFHWRMKNHEELDQLIHEVRLSPSRESIEALMRVCFVSGFGKGFDYCDLTQTSTGPEDWLTRAYDYDLF